MYRELEVNGAAPLSFHTDDFILKVSAPKVTEKLVENRDGEVEKLVENVDKLIEKLVEKATGNGDKLTENRIAILRLIAGNPYISQSELAESIGIKNHLKLKKILKQCEISISVVLDLTKVVSGK